MSEITRPLVTAASLLVLWFLAMVLEALGVPVWAMAMVAGLLLANLIAVTYSIHQVTRERDRPGGDGRRPDHPDTPGPGGGGDPSWWPEFERELTDYVAEREQGERRRQTVGAR